MQILKPLNIPVSCQTSNLRITFMRNTFSNCNISGMDCLTTMTFGSPCLQRAFRLNRLDRVLPQTCLSSSLYYTQVCHNFPTTPNFNQSPKCCNVWTQLTYYGNPVCQAMINIMYALFPMAVQWGGCSPKWVYSQQLSMQSSRLTRHKLIWNANEYVPVNI